jgi:hypothetical protein
LRREGKAPALFALSRATGGLRERMFSVVQVQPHPPSFLDAFAGYPPWFQVACLTVLAAVAIWLLGKLLKLAVWVLFFVVLIGGTIATLWLLFQ